MALLNGAGLARLAAFPVREDIAAGRLVRVLEHPDPCDREALHAIPIGQGGPLLRPCGRPCIFWGSAAGFLESGGDSVEAGRSGNRRKSVRQKCHLLGKWRTREDSNL